MTIDIDLRLERGFDQDLRDVDEMLDRGLIGVDALRDAFKAIQPGLYRFPAVDGAALGAAIERLSGARPAE